MGLSLLPEKWWGYSPTSPTFCAAPGAISSSDIDIAGEIGINAEDESESESESEASDDYLTTDSESTIDSENVVMFKLFLNISLDSDKSTVKPTPFSTWIACVPCCISAHSYVFLGGLKAYANLCTNG